MEDKKEGKPNKNWNKNNWHEMIKYTTNYVSKKIMQFNSPPLVPYGISLYPVMGGYDQFMKCYE